MKGKKDNRENHSETFDAIFELLSVSIDGDENNFERFVDRGLVKDIAEIVSRSNSQSIGYLPLLKLMTSICEIDVEVSAKRAK